MQARGDFAVSNDRLVECLHIAASALEEKPLIVPEQALRQIQKLLLAELDETIHSVLEVQIKMPLDV
jgi:hypothetical protein